MDTSDPIIEEPADDEDEPDVYASNQTHQVIFEELIGEDDMEASYTDPLGLQEPQYNAPASPLDSHYFPLIKAKLDIEEGKIGTFVKMQEIRTSVQETEFQAAKAMHETKVRANIQLTKLEKTGQIQRAQFECTNRANLAKLQGDTSEAILRHEFEIQREEQLVNLVAGASARSTEQTQREDQYQIDLLRAMETSLAESRARELAAEKQKMETETALSTVQLQQTYELDRMSRESEADLHSQSLQTQLAAFREQERLKRLQMTIEAEKRNSKRRYWPFSSK